MWRWPTDTVHEPQFPLYAPCANARRLVAHELPSSWSCPRVAFVIALAFVLALTGVLALAPVWVRPSPLKWMRVLRTGQTLALALALAPTPKHR